MHMQGIKNALTGAEIKLVRRWTVAVAAVYGLLGLLLFTAAWLVGPSTQVADTQHRAENANRTLALSSPAHGATPTATCAMWDQAAHASVNALTETNIALVRIEDSKFRMRRAQRNCAAGLIDLACGDYQVLLAGPLPANDRRRAADLAQSCRLAAVQGN